MSNPMILLVEQEYDFLANPDRTQHLPIEHLEEVLISYCVHKYLVHKASCREAQITPIRKGRYMRDTLRLNLGAFDERCHTLFESVLARV